MKGRGKDVWIDPELQHAEHRGDRIPGLDARVNQMLSLGGGNRDPRGFGVGDPTDEQDIRFLGGDPSQKIAPGFVRTFVETMMPHSIEPLIDVILDRDGPSRTTIDLTQEGMKRR